MSANTSPPHDRGIRAGQPAHPPSLPRRGRDAGRGHAGRGLLGTYDVVTGFAGTNRGAGNSTLVYWNLLTGGDGSHMVEMESYYTGPILR